MLTFVEKERVVTIMPLTMAQSGKSSIVQKIHGKDETRRFLENLGFIEGETVTVISEMGGNLIVKVKNAKIALSKSMANRIMV